MFPHVQRSHDRYDLSSTSLAISSIYTCVLCFCVKSKTIYFKLKVVKVFFVKKFEKYVFSTVSSMKLFCYTWHVKIVFEEYILPLSNIYFTGQQKLTWITVKNSKFNFQEISFSLIKI